MYAKYSPLPHPAWAFYSNLLQDGKAFEPAPQGSLSTLLFPRIKCAFPYKYNLVNSIANRPTTKSASPRRRSRTPPIKSVTL